MKTLYQLEQEAKEARDNAIFLHGSESPLSQDIVDSFINAAVAMVTYQFAIGVQEVIDCVPGDSNSCDGWIEWKGGNCPVDSDDPTIVKFRDGNQSCVPHKAGSYEWRRDIVERSWDIVAYKVKK